MMRKYPIKEDIVLSILDMSPFGLTSTFYFTVRIYPTPEQFIQCDTFENGQENQINSDGNDSGKQDRGQKDQVQSAADLSNGKQEDVLVNRERYAREEAKNVEIFRDEVELDAVEKFDV